ncbi:MAG: type VI secretion system contractile sheath small subunit [Deltaproteobacteria bacterium]|jgi:type VI secretion system protein ImpB|nr:type VI secretion system contractile sheath small subunit [Deltaproteobacteria bacterium]
MADDTTVAPKERVNIVYKPATGDAKTEVELPNKVLVVGDFTGAPDERSIEDRAPISVDKDNFEDVLKGQNLKMDFNVDNTLSGKPDDKLKVHLDIESLKDFGPDNVAKAIPEVAQLLELREALKTLKGPLANVPEFRKKIQELIKDPDAIDKVLGALEIDKPDTPDSK